MHFRSTSPTFYRSLTMYVGSIANMALAVLISAVLATGPLTISTATSGNVIVGLLVAIVFFLLFQKAVSGNRLAILKRLTVTNLAFSLIVIASYWSDLLSHYLVVSGDWGLLLLTFYFHKKIRLLSRQMFQHAYSRI